MGFFTSFAGIFKTILILILLSICVSHLVRLPSKMSHAKDQTTNNAPQQKQDDFPNSGKELYGRSFEDYIKFLKSNSVHILKELREFSLNLLFEGEWTLEEKTVINALINNNKNGFLIQRMENLYIKECANYGHSFEKIEITQVDATMKFHYEMDIIITRHNGKCEFELITGYTINGVEARHKNRIFVRIPPIVEKVGMDWFFTYPGT
jgi:hypothetical protein